MSEETKQDGLGKPNLHLTPAFVEAKLSVDLMKKDAGYHQVLSSVLQFEVSEENFEEAQELNKKIIRWLSFVEDHRAEEKKPYLESGRVIDAGHKKFAQPFEDAKASLQSKINIVGKRMADAAQKAKEEQERVEGLKNSINSFILDASGKIAAATTNEQLLSIERLINLEKGNKSRYQDHLPLLIERCNELTTKIKEQKELVKELEKAQLEAEAALQAGNDEKAQELLQKTELLGAKIEENSIMVQETASKSVITTEIIAPEIDMPNTRRKAWKFEAQDIKETIKKRPDLLDVSLNHKAVTEVLKTLKDSGVLNGKSEYILNGIRFFQDVNY